MIPLLLFALLQQQVVIQGGVKLEGNVQFDPLHLVAMKWDAPTDPLSVTAYHIYRWNGSGFQFLGATTGLNKYTDFAVTAGSTYSYYVAAANSQGESPPSQIVACTVPIVFLAQPQPC